MATPLHTQAVLTSTAPSGEFRLLALAFLAVMGSLAWELTREGLSRMTGKARVPGIRR
jgi:hypothetical protein